MVYALLTIGFHMLMYFGHQSRGLRGKILGLFPSALVVAGLVLKPVASCMNMHYTQGFFTVQVRKCHVCRKGHAMLHC